MLQRLVLLLAVCLTGTFSSDTAYRLNTPIRPESYVLSIKPYFDTGDVKAFSFDGQVTINFVTHNVTNQIKLHAEDLEFSADNITVRTISGLIVPLKTENPLEFDKNYTFAFVNLQADLDVGVTYQLQISYRGKIRNDLTGFYRNYYMEKGVKKWLGATQMQPTNARRVFPCFDEPMYKATFQISIQRPSSFQPSRSNAKLNISEDLKNGFTIDQFHRTPIMSTYLVAFLVSEFEVAHYSVNGTREFGIVTRPEAKNQTDYTFDFGQRVVTALGAYFGIDYYSVDPNIKLDHVALVDFKAGAMENWGLVTYRESLFMYVPNQSTPYIKYRVLQIVAHETTHMWFGDLVTCHWWSDTWLNEGFANYFQDYITSLIEPDVGSADIQVTSSTYTAYEDDATVKAVPISNKDVNSPDEINKHFGTFSYQKPGSIIRMMHNLMGNDAFILGLNTHLITNKFKVAYPETLYSALQEGVDTTNSFSEYPGATVEGVMSSWITQAGHPLLDVQVNYETGYIKLTQTRFYCNSSLSSNEIYNIPISYTTGVAHNFNDTKPAFIMSNKTHNFIIPNLNNNWIIFNIQETGFYRVNYDDRTWDKIVEVLKSDKREQIHHLNRAKIVNDMFALYRADKVSFKRLKDTLDFLKSETDYSVWYAAASGLKYLRNVFVGSDALTAIDNYIADFVDKTVEKFGYAVGPSEGTVSQRNRLQILDLACRCGHKGCLSNATKLYQNFTETNEEIHPGLRQNAYCYGLKNGDEKDFEFLWQRMKTTNLAGERAIILEALGCSSVTEKIKQYLTAMKSEENQIRIQDLTAPLKSVLNHHEHVNLVLDELKNNFSLWNSLHPTMDKVLTTTAEALRTVEEINRFEEWLAACCECTAKAVKAARSSLNDTKLTLSWRNAHKAELLRVLNSSTIFAAPTMYVLLISLVAIFLSTN